MSSVHNITSVASGLLCVLAAAPTSARTFTQFDQPLGAGEVSRAALRFVRAQATRFELPPSAGLAVEGTTPVRGGTVVRVVRSDGALKAANAGLNLIVLGGHVVAASGDLSGQLETTPARLDAAAVAKLVTARIPGSRVLRNTQVLWRVGRRLRRAFATDVYRASPLGAFRAITDAANGDPLSGSNLLTNVAGKAYMPNPVKGQMSAVQLEGLLQPIELIGEYADASSCTMTQGKLECTRYAIPDSTSGDFLFDPEEPSFTDPFAEVHAYYHVDAFHRWLGQTFGFTRKGATQQIEVMVNFNYETATGGAMGSYNNAFFGDANGDGRRELVFGQAKRDLAYDADVIYHEFTHSVVDETSDLQASIDTLGFNVMPMGLNEGFADLLSCSFTGDGVVGDYAGGKDGIRNLEGPASCPDSLSGEEHSDGLIWGRACWAVRQQTADKAAFDDVLYKTMVGLDKSAEFADAAALLVKLAQVSAPALASEAQKEFAARGLLDCSRIVPLTENQKRRGYTLGRRSAPSLPAIPAGMQYEIKVPADALSMWVTLKPISYHMGFTFNMGAYVRKDTPVAYTGSKPSFDFVLSSNQTSIYFVPGDAKFPLEPGATYYVLPLNVALDATYYELSMGLTRENPPAPDASPVSADAGVNPASPDGQASDAAGPGPDVDGDQGCSCSLPAAQQRASSPLSATLALLLLVASRRRRKR